MYKLTSKELRDIRRLAKCEGIREGRRRSQKLVNQLNAALIETAELLSVVDWRYPRTGVTISFDMTEYIIDALRGKKDKKVCSRLARELKELYDDVHCQIGEPMQACKEDLLQILER